MNSGGGGGLISGGFIIGCIFFCLQVDGWAYRLGERFISGKWGEGVGGYEQTFTVLWKRLRYNWRGARGGLYPGGLIIVFFPLFTGRWVGL